MRRLLDWYFKDLRWIVLEVTVSRPRRSNSKVRYARPTLAFRAIWVDGKVDPFAAVKIFAAWLISQPLVLNGCFIVPADYKGCAWAGSQVLALARGFDRVEYEFQIRRHRDTHKRRLRPLVLRNASDHRKLVVPNEFVQLPFGHA
jgi:hypothetical protein